MTEWTLFQMVVPESVMPELARFAADLIERETARDQPPETTEDRVMSLWIKLTADGRAALLTLARLTLEAGGDWISWTDLYPAMGLDARQASGVIGNIHKVLKGLRGEDLVERTYRGGLSQFRMVPAVARVIVERG